MLSEDTGLNYLNQLRATGYIVVLRVLEPGKPVESIVEAVCEGGARFVEVTTNTYGWQDRISQVARHPGVVPGAGTVTRVEDVHAAYEAGAKFIFAPNTNPVVIEATLSLGMLPIPGALTPTEITVALAAGAPAVKIFPAGSLGLPYLAALRGPFPDVSFIPTGGIGVNDAADWIRGGALAVGLGGALTEGTPEEIRSRVRTLTESLMEVR